MPITYMRTNDRAIKILIAIMVVLIAIGVIWAVGSWLGVLPSSF